MWGSRWRSGLSFITRVNSFASAEPALGVMNVVPMISLVGAAACTDVYKLHKPWLQSDHRHSYSTSSSSTVPPPSVISPANNHSTWEKQVLYRGRGIKTFRVLVRLKIIQLSGIAALAVPISAFINTGEISHLQTLIASSLVVGSAVASTTLWYYSRRYVGELSLLKPPPASTLNTDTTSSSTATTTSSQTTNTNDNAPLVRFSVLDFWGNRENVDVKIEDIIPPLHNLPPAVSKAVAAEPLLPVQVSGDRQFILSLRYGHVMDGSNLKALLRGELKSEE